MPIGVDDNSRKFITTEPLGDEGEVAEAKVWNSVRKSFAHRDCIAYWRYPIFGKAGEFRKEPDILIVDRALGLIVIEVKSLAAEQILSINGHQWQYRNFYQKTGNPYQQAERQLKAILSYSEREPCLRGKVRGKAVVGLPLISKEQWSRKGFDRLPSNPPIIFKDHLGPQTMQHIINRFPDTFRGERLTDAEWELLLCVIAGTPILKKTDSETVKPANINRRSDVIRKAASRIRDLDLQQEHISKEIPPGPQRLRGIAGSGKTVLLCQKAAHMHLKHPEWDIALVFFTRSLYEQMIDFVDRWIRHFTNDQVAYDINNSKLKILHAWGGRYQPGLYSTICRSLGKKPGTVQNTDEKEPVRALADLCNKLIQELEILPIFDAILIDEGQDLVVEDDLKYNGKQPIYWMAYQSLRPVSKSDPQQRRLIWSYDEGQSLYNLKIPTAVELFGSEHKDMVSGAYKGGIKKSEIMHRCYRTPALILSSAHALGMGLLRPEGMLSGITNKQGWEAIGYKIHGQFRLGNTITLSRPIYNSLNPIPDLWPDPVLDFQVYSSRHEELEYLANNIRSNLEIDGLKASRNIVIIPLGNIYEAQCLEKHIAEVLINRNINVYIPATDTLNTLNTKDSHYTNKNRFWYDGGVTISRIHRAKGNEADMVYVIGLDNIAKLEADVSLRNQLFVAMTRARGWCKLSGVGSYPMFQEVQQVINSNGMFTFTYRKAPERDLGDEEFIQANLFDLPLSTTDDKTIEGQLLQTKITSPYQKYQISKDTSHIQGEFDAVLYEKLCVLRLYLANEQRMPENLVFSDYTLREFARIQPLDLDTFGAISGVGRYKLEHYGPLFLHEILMYKQS